MKRRWKAALGGLGLIVVVGGAAFMYVRTYEPDRTRYPVRGIDVSHHQGTIDWPAVAADDVAFAYVKVSEGGDHRDREFGRNIAEANRLGLPVGAYHFFTLCRPGADQAANFIDAVPAGAAQLPPVVDLEFTGNCARRPTPEAFRADIEAFITRVEAALGQPLIYYIVDDFRDAYGEVLPPRRLWRRAIFHQPDADDWLIWQYHPAGRVAGIDGDVDLNVLEGDLAELVGGG
ncbi:GH25 family lysozyme [Bauldia sp.]|uniref:GH25 family lysozyme n=1 Tax=Bauldia sp. TaxID=2575872 RepID=UPI003BAD2963